MRLLTREVRVHLCTRGPLRLPYHAGGLVHGVLGRALHGGPLWARLFAPCARPGHPFLRPGAPCCAALIPVLPAPGRRALAEGERFSVQLRLFGDLREKERALLVDRLAGLGALPWRQVALRCLAVDVEEPVPLSLPWPAAPSAAPGGSQALLRLVTPACLLREGEVLTALSGVDLCRRVFRRWTELCAQFGELLPAHRELLGALEVHARDVALEARLQPVRWERLSQERGERHPLAGVLGELALSGAVAPLWPLLQVAERIHLGKQTSFGLGRVQLERRDGVPQGALSAGSATRD